jgi:hypothetical protein
MPQKYGSHSAQDRRNIEGQRTADATAHPDTKLKSLPLESPRSKAEFLELQRRWSFLEWLYKLPF